MKVNNDRGNSPDSNEYMTHMYNKSLEVIPEIVDCNILALLDYCVIKREIDSKKNNDKFKERLNIFNDYVKQGERYVGHNIEAIVTINNLIVQKNEGSTKRIPSFFHSMRGRNQKCSEFNRYKIESIGSLITAIEQYILVILQEKKKKITPQIKEMLHCFYELFFMLFEGEYQDVIWSAVEKIKSFTKYKRNNQYKACRYNRYQSTTNKSKLDPKDQFDKLIMDVFNDDKEQNNEQS